MPRGYSSTEAWSYPLSEAGTYPTSPGPGPGPVPGGLSHGCKTPRLPSVRMGGWKKALLGNLRLGSLQNRPSGFKGPADSRKRMTDWASWPLCYPLPGLPEGWLPVLVGVRPASSLSAEWLDEVSAGGKTQMCPLGIWVLSILNGFFLHGPSLGLRKRCL